MTLRDEVKKLAAEQPELRKHLLPLLRTGSVKSLEDALVNETTDLAAFGPKDRMNMRGRSLWWPGVEVLIYETNSRGTIINVEGEEYRNVRDAAKALRRLS